MRDGDSSKLKKSNKTRQSKEANEIHILKGWVEHLISLYHSKISVMNQAYKEMEDFKLHDEQLYWITICIEHSSIPYLIVKIKKAKGQTNRKYNKIKRHSYLWRLWRGTSILLTCHLWIDFPRDLIINEWEMEAAQDHFRILTVVLADSISISYDSYHIHSSAALNILIWHNLMQLTPLDEQFCHCFLKVFIAVVPGNQYKQVRFVDSAK